MKKYFFFILLLVGMACKPPVPIDDIVTIPEVTAADSAFINVFNSLQGNWIGNFEIYRDDVRGPRNDEILYDLSPSLLNMPNLNAIQMIRVYQHYESLTPFFQKVNIRDVYIPDNRSVVSEGVNKIQDGKMWCVVHKPDETIIHEGSLDGPETIIWQRNEQNPQKVEYFRETVSGDRYVIIGWGYYEGDDITQMPKYWYYGVYTRDY